VVIDYKAGYSMTVAPLVANGVLITGISGGEYGIRGFLDGWEPETGEHLWRLHHRWKGLLGAPHATPTRWRSWRPGALPRR